MVTLSDIREDKGTSIGRIGFFISYGNKDTEVSPKLKHNYYVTMHSGATGNALLPSEIMADIRFSKGAIRACLPNPLNFKTSRRLSTRLGRW